jgi:eukaryotic-like serine/threonine-protein kinase
MSLAAGTILGQYQIRSPLGAGGMGEVYRAHDTRLDREVAIKVLPESVTADPDRLRRFEQEARAAAALNHPNILAVYQMATHDGVSYMVTELLDGETLRERLRRGPIQLRKAMDYGVQIAHGLAAAHEKGIVHRDLKPENLFVTKDGRVKILDFGLAKFTPPPDASTTADTVSLNQHTEPGMVIGTVGYMSPEQVRGQAADPRSDIFAFGTILYEMVTGKQTFRKPTSAETIGAILHEEPPSISKIVPSTPPGLQRVVHRCLEKNAEQRFHSAHDLAFALEAMSDLGISSAASAEARNSALPELSANLEHAAGSGDVAVIERQSRGRSRQWAWLAVGAVVAALAAVVVFWWTRPPGAPFIEAINQLTDDGKPKGVHESLQSDGSRLYFNEGRLGTLTIAQVAVSGGRVAQIPTPLLDAQPVGIEPDGSALLVMPGGAGPPAKPLWKIPLPAGDPIRLANLAGQDGYVAPDGRIFFSNLGDLYVAEKDGSNPRKIVGGIVGFIGNPSLSPDGRRMVFTRYPTDEAPELYEANGDGSGVRLLAKSKEPGGFCCPQWTPDGRYIVFETRWSVRQDLWYMPMRRGWMQKAGEPKRLTAGPISYFDPVPSRDGRQIFALGNKQRGELVRYDLKSQQFLPILPGVSATNLMFSRDGAWVTYLSFPDRVAWRSRSDGTDRLQLVFPPLEVGSVAISPDGKRIAYDAAGNIYLIGIDGGAPEAIVKDGKSWAADWSPDANRIVFFSSAPEQPGLFVLDLRTRTKTPVPQSNDLTGARWIGEDKLVAVGSTGLRLFDLKTQTWSNWNFEPKLNLITRLGVWPDHEFLYLTTGGSDPQVMRIRAGEHAAQGIASLKDFQFAMLVQYHGANREVDVAPDGSPVFTRDTGAQEVYALTVKWP